MAYIKRYNVVGQILWEKDGFYKITFNHNGDIKTEIFVEKEFDDMDVPILKGELTKEQLELLNQK